MANKPNFVGMYLPRLIQQGHTATSAAAALRGQGMRFGDTMFRRLWAETQDQIARSEKNYAVPLNRRPSVDEVGIATRPKARGFLYLPQIAVYDSETQEVSFHVWGVRTTTLISHARAMAIAIEQWTQAQQGGRDTPGGTPVGALAGDVLKLVGPEETLGNAE